MYASESSPHEIRVIVLITRRYARDDDGRGRTTPGSESESSTRGWYPRDQCVFVSISRHRFAAAHPDGFATTAADAKV